MKPLLSKSSSGADVINACVHWKSFPPPFSTSGVPPESLRSSGHVTESEYHRLKTWERVCGLVIMEHDKCSKCEHFRVAEIKDGLPVLTSKSGMSVPAVDIATLELNASRIYSNNRMPKP